MYQVRFRWKDTHAKEVFLCTSLNWKNKHNLIKVSQNTFETIISMPRGNYEYKFIVDNVWKHNPVCPKKMNSFGTLNNIIIVNNNKVVKNYFNQHKHVVFKNNIKQYRIFYPNIIDPERPISLRVN